MRVLPPEWMNVMIKAVDRLLPEWLCYKNQFSPLLPFHLLPWDHLAQRP